VPLIYPPRVSRSSERRGQRREEKGMRTTAYTGVGGRRLRSVVLLAVVAVALAGVLLAAQRSASAHDHLIPKSVLVKGDKELQVGRQVKESSWTYLDGEGGLNTDTAYYAWSFPEVDRVAAGSEMRLRIFKDRQPEVFVLAAYPKVTEKGRPSGEKRLLNVSFEPVVRDGLTVAWDAVFDVERPDRHYYLVGRGHWQDAEGSGEQQYAHWSFHAKTRSVQ
jgi:hypothetical protein